MTLPLDDKMFRILVHFKNGEEEDFLVQGKLNLPIKNTEKFDNRFAVFFLKDGDSARYYNTDSVESFHIEPAAPYYDEKI